MNISKLDETRKKALLNSALKEFIVKGYDDASTNVIARDAGMSKALMFHYVENKQALFLFVYDYFAMILEKEYYKKLKTENGDLFNRLKQSYLLQLDLLTQYPWLLDFDRLTNTITMFDINKDIRLHKEKLTDCTLLFTDIDISKFRDDLDVETCKQVIFYSNMGFIQELLSDLKRDKVVLDYEQIVLRLEKFLGDLRNVFYTSNEVVKNESKL